MENLFWLYGIMLTMLTTDEGSHAAQDHQEVSVRGLLSEPGVRDFTDGQGLFSVLKTLTMVATWPSAIISKLLNIDISIKYPIFQLRQMLSGLIQQTSGTFSSGVLMKKSRVVLNCLILSLNQKQK